MQNTEIPTRYQLAAIMNAASDAVIGVTLERVVLSWSRGAEKIYGYSAEEVIGRSLDLLIPPEQIPEIEQAISKIARGTMVEAFETTRFTKDGKSLQVAISLTPITDATENVCGVITMARDVSARKQDEEALRSRLRQQAAVASLGQRALAGTDTHTLMEEAVALLARTLDVEFCKVLQLQSDGHSLLLRAGVGWQEGLVGRAVVGSERESQAGYTLMNGTPVIVEDLRSETRFSGPSLLHQHNVISGMSVIIQGREGPFGVLGVHTTRRHVFTHEDIHFLQAVANVLAAAIQRSEADADRVARAQAEQAVATLEATVHQRAVIWETANHVALDILSSRTGVEALRHIADAARVLAGARYAALGVARHIGDLPEGRQELQEFVTVGITPEEQARIGPLPRGLGILGLLLERTEPLRIDVLAEHPASVGFPANHPPMQAFLGVPIRRGETTVGSLYLTNKQGGGAFTQADEVAVQALGAHAAVAIHNLHLLSRQRALVAGLLTAQEEERRAVAYDLHDGLTQYVMAAHAHLESSQRAHRDGRQDKSAREMEQGLKYLKEAVLESRRLVNGLRSLALDDLGLSGAMEQLLSEEKARCGWEDAKLMQNIEERRFDNLLETGAYRVAQEALTNIRKHAQTSRVQVLLRFETSVCSGQSGECLRLQVRDWGQGFEPEQQMIEVGHIGLQGMAERVHLLGGTFELHSAPGQGTTITAVFPVLTTQQTDEHGH